MELNLECKTEENEKISVAPTMTGKRIFQLFRQRIKKTISATPSPNHGPRLVERKRQIKSKTVRTRRAMPLADKNIFLKSNAVKIAIKKIKESPEKSPHRLISQKLGTRVLKLKTPSKSTPKL